MKAVINRGYRPYEGKKYIRPLRFWPILRNELTGLWKLKRIRFFVYSLGLVAFGLGLMVFLFNILLKNVPMPGSGDNPFKDLLDSTQIYQVYLNQVRFFTFIFCAIVGGGLIANDLKTKAMPLYFSKPLGWPIYLLGKCLVLALAIFLVVFLPSICIFLSKLMTSDTPRQVFLTESPYVVGVFFYALLHLLVLTPILLAISCSTESYNYAFISFIILIMVLSGVANFFAVNDPNGIGKNSYALDLGFCLRKAGEQFFPKQDGKSSFLNNLSQPPPRRNRRQQPPPMQQVQEEKWIYINLGFWVLLSTFWLFLRLKKIEVQE